MAVLSSKHPRQQVASIALITLFSISCSSPSNPPINAPATSNPTDIPAGIVSGPVEFFWGSWLRMDGDNTAWYIASDGVAVGSASKSSVASPTQVGFSLAGKAVTKVTDNLLKVESSGSLFYYLFRKSGVNATASLGVKTLGAGSRGLAGIGGIQMIISNKQNPGNGQTVQTGSGGGASLTGLIVGDTYSVTVPVQSGVTTAVSTTVTPVFDGENLGFITVGQTQQNFKVSYAITGNPTWLFRGQDYSLTIKIKNIGSQDMLLRVPSSSLKTVP